jgi:hypothetical protein
MTMRDVWFGIGAIIIAGALLGALNSVQSEAPTPPQTPTMQEQLAQQTALLERIATLLERWDAERTAAKAAAEERSRRVMPGWRPGETQGLQELPTTFERQH